MAAYTTIDDPSAYFKVQLWTGDGTAIGSGGKAITFDDTDTDMQPDLVWIKERSSTSGHQVIDAVRGTTKHLETEDDGQESTQSEGLTTFGSDGFTVGENGAVNQSSQTYVAWCWKANGSGSANSVGDISSTVSANTTSGISIVKYQGSGTGSDTVGHGGVQPDFITIKATSAASDWITTTKDIAGYIYISTTAALTSNSTWLPLTSTTFELENTWGAYNTSGRDYIAYLFKSIQGFSAIGSYKGNGNAANNTFVYTGFKVGWVLIKRSSSSGEGWFIFDSTRSPANLNVNELRADTNSAETTGSHYIDFLSNGFKPKTAGAGIGGSGDTYIYLAFAEAPFVNSNGVPCNAR